MRGMDTSLVFAMIFAVIFIGLLLVFGMGQITNMFCFNGNAQVDKAVKDLENDVQNVYNLAEGASKLFRVSIPSGSSICVVNTSNPDINPAGYWMPNPDQMPVISQKIMLKDANVWINYNCGSNEQTYRIEHLRAVRQPGAVGTGSFCASGGSSIYLENAGDYVAASPA